MTFKKTTLPKLTSKQIDQVFKVLSKTITSPKTELNYSSVFELLIAVILSAQATDVSVNKVTPSLFKVAPTPEKMIRLGASGLQKYIKSIGLYKTKASNIIKTCQMLIVDYNSSIPDSRTELEKLPGVGRKTAGVVLNVAFKKSEIPVDTHVFRTSNRIGLVKAKTPKETEIQLQRVVPDWVKINAHHLLILHGRFVCKARKPLCQTCCINDCCHYFKESGF